MLILKIPCEDFFLAQMALFWHCSLLKIQVGSGTWKKYVKHMIENHCSNPLIMYKFTGRKNR